MRYEGCVVRADEVTLEGVTVRPIGEPPLILGLAGVPARVHVARRRNMAAEIEVDGAISFVANRKNVWFTIVADVESQDGMVALHRGARLTDAFVEHGLVVGSAVLYSNDVLEGEDKEPDETVSPVRIPCGALALGPVEMEEGDDDPPESPGDGWWKPKRNVGHVRLRSQPREDASAALLATPSCENCIELKRIREEGAWMLVERAGEGVTVRGWVRRAALNRRPDDVRGGGRTYGCFGDHGGGGWNEGWASGPPVGLYDGAAVVHAGTRVFAEPQRGEWALIKSDMPVRVRYVRGESWVELREIPGLDGSPAGSPWFHAHVPVEDVAFPNSRPLP